MKKFLFMLVMVVGLLSLNQVSAQNTGVIGGYDSEYTTQYNTVSIYNTNSDYTGKFYFSYDTYYDCWNNIKFYNNSSYTGYVRMKVWVGGYSYVNQKVWVESYKSTYLNDVFKHCSSSRKDLKVSISTW